MGYIPSVNLTPIEEDVAEVKTDTSIEMFSSSLAFSGSNLGSLVAAETAASDTADHKGLIG